MRGLLNFIWSENSLEYGLHFQLSESNTLVYTQIQFKALNSLGKKLSAIFSSVVVMNQLTGALFFYENKNFVIKTMASCFLWKIHDGWIIKVMNFSLNLIMHT